MLDFLYLFDTVSFELIYCYIIIIFRGILNPVEF